MAKVSYLHKELYVLEVPKAIRKEEIGLFFEVRNKSNNKDNKMFTCNYIEILKGLTPSPPSSKVATIPVELKPMFKNAFLGHSGPEVDAQKYIKEFLEFNEDAFIICDHYLDKKILSTPELDLFIRRHFMTAEQLKFYMALIPAYLAIIVSILLPFMQKQDNTDIIKLQHQLKEIHKELSEIKTTNLELYELNDKLYNINIEEYDDTEIENILMEIKKQLAKENN